ncbi:hypothetical protein P879_09854 [Paragonimus westermani]|uniref:Uncharacterized protein n=1 Tax=Paragonimus westermani TaxID=34504 RepID=A0A8T0DAK2_9TREM|nr:hypothetical protein P879_09854 [Paragonimus westermani]
MQQLVEHQVIESESRIVREPDGTEVRTIVERSPQGERRRIVRRTPAGEEEVQETDTDSKAPKLLSRTVSLLSGKLA